MAKLYGSKALSFLKKVVKRGKKSGKYSFKSKKSVGSSGTTGKSDQIPNSGVSVRQIALKPSNTGPFPETFYTKHRYVTSIVLTSVVGGVCSTSHDFRLNGLYDPDITLTGHQPYGFDQISTAYNRYCVYGVSIQIQALSTTGTLSSWSGTKAIVYRLGSSYDTYSMNLKTYEEILETPGGGGQVLAAPNSGMLTNFDLGYHKIADLDGVAPSVVTTETDYSAQSSANPTVGPRIQICACNPDSSAEAELTRCIVTIVFHTQWKGRRGMAQS